jgi:hypothetical protein
MSTHEKQRLIEMLDRLDSTMARMSDSLVLIGHELRGFRRDLEDLRREHDARLAKLEGKLK